jgi:DNA modification methylase
MVITDPPYNVRIDGHARGLGKDQHADFAMASGEMSEEEFTAFLQTVCDHMATISRPGALHYVCMDWRHMWETLQAGRATYERLINLCVWAKGAGGMGSFYRSEHELVFVWRTKGAGHVNNVQLGRFGRNRTNVWRYSGANSFGAERDEMLRLHPTVKPTAMIADAIRDGSKRDEIVLDPFLGSGTTILAAEQTDRIGVGIEFEPKYADVVVQRFEKLTGCKARHESSGLTFAEEAELRSKTESTAKAVSVSKAEL